MKKIITPGGKRVGAGRPPGPYKTVAVGIRVPVQFKKQITEMVKVEVKRLLKKAETKRLLKNILSF